ncbi:hypothetical protein K9N68_37415 (plasmid) [Kovacikia minuta CCNUW1]|uniref:hypothetical protein n=1 Tax=Kovacikia minuta TaxID=2931930 RepID=UPI001CCDEC39|nr:hypothetical protein [Kovacikia minuta]UBF29893.1 hypothetical protein K9N68_37415 [Kovacikia minuta CCNUW1]
MEILDQEYETWFDYTPEDAEMNPKDLLESLLENSEDLPREFEQEKKSPPVRSTKKAPIETAPKASQSSGFKGIKLSRSFRQRWETISTTTTLFVVMIGGLKFFDPGILTTFNPPFLLGIGMLFMIFGCLKDEWKEFNDVGAFVCYFLWTNLVCLSANLISDEMDCKWTIPTYLTLVKCQAKTK